MAPRETRNDDDPVAAFDSAHASVAAAQRRLLAALPACERARVWEQDGSRDLAQWVSARLGISNWAARRLVVAARALEGLPRLGEALESGELSQEKACELARFATPGTEKRLIAWARRVSRVRRKADLACRADIEEMREADRARFLRGWWYEDGSAYALDGVFPAHQGAVIERALQQAAQRVPEDPSSDATLPYEVRAEARRADALFMLASGALAADPEPERATVVVHAPLESLSGDAGGCEVEGGPVLHPEVAARLACDARLQVVSQDRSGGALGVGWARRNPPAWLLRMLRRRDRGCVFPGCELRRFVHAHHIVSWPRGPTNLENLVLVCPFHHKLVHEGRWRVELAEPGGATWFRPDGRRLRPTAVARPQLDRGPPDAA